MEVKVEGTGELKVTPNLTSRDTFWHRFFRAGAATRASYVKRLLNDRE